MKYEIIETYPESFILTGGVLCDLTGKNDGTRPDFLCATLNAFRKDSPHTYMRGTNNVCWYHWDGGKWIKKLIAENYCFNVGMSTADITGSGKQDVVFVEWHDRYLWLKKVRKPGGIYWAEQPDDPFNDTWNVHMIGEGHLNAHDAITGDVDGDGKPDVVIRNKDGMISWFKSGKDPRNLWIEHKVTEHHNGDGTALYDVTGSGSNDIVTGSGYFENMDGKGGRWQFHSYGIENLNMHPEARVAAGDLIGDNSVSVVITESELTPNARIAIVTSKDGGKTWSSRILVDRDKDLRAPHTLHLYDINGDGYTDIFTVEMENGKTDGINKKPCWYAYINKGNLDFEEIKLLDANIGGHQACVGPIRYPGKTGFIGKSWRGNKNGAMQGMNHLIHIFE